MLPTTRSNTLTMDVPLTLATIRVLLVEAGGAILAVPSNATRSLVRVRAEEIVPVEGRPTLHWHGASAALLSLARALGLPELPVEGPRPGIVVGEDGHPTALLVDRLLDEIEVLVRPLGTILGTSPFFSAATLLGSDQVVPILDLTGLLAVRPAFSHAAGPLAEAAAGPRRVPRILLVEDAITTRELERSILEAAGYEVEAAFDGLDAMQRLEQSEFQLIISDIEMPRMDGFELTSKIRGDTRLARLPVMLVTGMETQEQKERGIDVGANAYLTKSSFTQGTLLETARSLL